jgi:hypothetical protein
VVNVKGGFNKMARVKLTDQDGNLIDSTNGLPVHMTNAAGSKVVEQKTQADATTGTVTFSENIETLEIFNVDATNQGIFNVNGLNITVPAGKTFKATFGGSPRTTVTITGSTSYILTRYE